MRGCPTAMLLEALCFRRIGSGWSFRSWVSYRCWSWRGNRWSRAFHDDTTVHGRAAVRATAGNDYRSASATSRSWIAAAWRWSWAAARCWSWLAACRSWLAAYWSWLAASINGCTAVGSLFGAKLSKESSAATTLGCTRTQFRKQSAAASCRFVTTALAAKTSLNISASGQKHGQASDARN